METLNDPFSVPQLLPSMLITGKTRLVLPPPGEFKREEMEKEMETHTTLGAIVLVKVEQGIFAAVARKKQVVSPRRNFKIGDVVLLKENQSPRNRRPMAKVVVTHPDDHGQVRSVSVLTSNGSNLERPVNKLVLLVEAQQTPGFPDEEPEHY